MTVISTPEELTPAVLNKAVGRYYKELQEYASQADHELALRPAFQNLLAEMARRINLTLVHEMTIRGRIRPDGVLCNAFHIQRGYWEAKGPRSNLEEEIRQKIKDGYPLDNALFENTRQAVLFQAGQRYSFNLRVPSDVATLLRGFLTYQKPDTARFEQAVVEFQEQIPNIAKRLLELINEEYQRNRIFIAAFADFTELCRSTLNPQISTDEIKEMLIQHLLTERLFRTVFNNPDFIRQNVVAAKIEQLVQALTSRTFNRAEFLRSLDPFYGAVEGAARGIETWSERQHFLNLVYERFFQGFSVKKADTHGIVYTPQEIVNFMVESVNMVLKQEFGKSIETPGVKILDPATGTGNFIVNIIRRMSGRSLKEKYANDLFCNEVMLLPYYVASLNIEHAYYEQMKRYEPFKGICFADTLEMAEGKQLSLFAEENTERVKREKEADIMVVIGNPPYNVGQKNENDNNKNRPYAVIDQRIKETYVKDSKATLNNKLYDAYVRFFRWATDRLHGDDGIVCFVSNNSFIEGYAFDGFRKRVTEEFTSIHHIDLGGNARKQRGGNVFNIMVGVGITLFVRNRKGVQSPCPLATIHYHQVNDVQKGTEKLAFLGKAGSIKGIAWQELQPDTHHTWITDKLLPEFAAFLPIGVREAKISHNRELPVLFKSYSGGVKTNRDNWAYDFDAASLASKMKRLIDTYNGEIDRWKRRTKKDANIDDFVIYNDKLIKWSGDLKMHLMNGKYALFSEQNIRCSLSRPFVKRYLYFDPILNNRRYLQHLFFPIPASEIENVALIVSDVSYRSSFSILAANTIPDLHTLASVDAFQCFPYYTYAEDGSNRRENITDWALKQFQAKYGEQVSKWDIFHYVYGMLHHPQYRELYKENLKHDLPHIPLVVNEDAFEACVSIGKQLMTMHVQYESEEEYSLHEVHNREVPYDESLRVEKMKLSPDRTTLIYSQGLTLEGIPQECFAYRLGNRSALEWVIDQYQVSTDKRSGITSDPNRLDDPEYVVRLVKQVVAVSVKTVQLVRELSKTVTANDWGGQ